MRRGDPDPRRLDPERLVFPRAVRFAVIAALVTEPIPGPLVGLLGVTGAALLGLVAPDPASSIRWALTGFSDGTVWLMFVVLMFALGYQKTELGHRIALTLVERLGSRTLGLGYAVAFADLVLAPLTPSNTARSGGIVFPIIRAIPALYGSQPGPTARRLGAYLLWTGFATMCVTSSMFVTALAPNLLAQAMLKDIAGVHVTWIEWFIRFLPIGLVLFGLAPAGVLDLPANPHGQYRGTEVGPGRAAAARPHQAQRADHGAPGHPRARAVDPRRPLRERHGGRPAVFRLMILSPASSTAG